MREGEPRLILQTDQAPSAGLLFTLLPGPATRSHPALVGGSRQGFAQLSAAFELTQLVKLQPKLIASAELAHALAALPSVAVLPVQSRELLSSSGWQALQDSDCVFIGLDMHLASSQQIILSQVMRTLSTLMVCTDELAAMFRFEPELLRLSTIIPFLRVESLKRQALGLQVPVRSTEARGVYGVADVLRSVDALGPLLIAYTDNHWYSYVRSEDCVVHSPLPAGSTVEEFIRIYWVALCLTVFARGQVASLLERVQVAHYLTHQVLAQANPLTSDQAHSLTRLLEG
ncbi:MAG: hypothetical protein U0526_04220 [Candidatus Saccharibacteria bacterium]